MPPNLFIIGTMNTTDRSVGSIDYEVRRRLAFVTLKADKSVIEGCYRDTTFKSKALDYVRLLEELLKTGLHKRYAIGEENLKEKTAMRAPQATSASEFQAYSNGFSPFGVGGGVYV